MIITASIGVAVIAWWVWVAVKVERHPSHPIGTSVYQVAIMPLIMGFFGAVIGGLLLLTDLIVSAPQIDDWFYNPLALAWVGLVAIGSAFSTASTAVKKLQKPNYRRVAAGLAETYDDDVRVGILAPPPIKPRACATFRMKAAAAKAEEAAPKSSVAQRETSPVVADIFGRLFDKMADDEDDPELAAQQRRNAEAMRAKARGDLG